MVSRVWTSSIFALLLGFASGCAGDAGAGETDTDTDSDGDDSAWTSWTGGGSSTRGDSSPGTFTTSQDPTSDDTTTDEPPTSDSDEPATDGESATDDSASDTESGGQDTTDTSDNGDPGNCCQEGTEAGCENDAVAMCVCDQDPFCCSNQWDLACAVKAVEDGCATCEGIGGDGDCCTDNGSPGCSDNAIEACVCLEDIVCCTESWDSICAMQVESLECGQC